jgi:hypothetical protein
MPWTNPTHYNLLFIITQQHSYRDLTMQPADSLPIFSTPSAGDTSSASRLKSPLQSPFTIGELTELIFNYLDARELLRIIATSKSMHGMLQVPSI